ncbi:MAG TPA: HdeD family acid-resistance protein [Anaerolineales bacterium]
MIHNGPARNWRLVVLRGILAILFGVMAFGWPSMTWIILIMMFGVYTLADGLVALGTGLSRTNGSPRWWTVLLEGVLSLAAAVVALLWPEIIALIMVFVIAGWAVLTGILEIVAAIRLRAEIKNEWLLALGGLVSIALGVFLFFQPVTGGIAIIWTLAAYAMIFGVLLIALGLRLRDRIMSGDLRRLHSA